MPLIISSTKFVTNIFPDLLLLPKFHVATRLADDMNWFAEIFSWQENTTQLKLNENRHQVGAPLYLLAALFLNRDVLKRVGQWDRTWPRGFYQSWYCTIPLPAYPDNDRGDRYRPLRYPVVRDTQDLTDSTHAEKPASFSSSIAALAKLSTSACSSR